MNKSATCVSLDRLSVSKGETVILDQFSIAFNPARWTCILGRSGCGKTTLLRLIAGLEPSCPITTYSPYISYMAQKDLLLPWMNAVDNVLLGLRLRGQRITPKHRSKAIDLLAAVNLADYANALPQTLSGGMRQRVALARTLIEDCPLVLMDEPFSALDALTRLSLQNLACSLLIDRTTIMITHDPLEALRLGQAIIVVHGPPLNIKTVIERPEPLPHSFDPDLHSQILDHLI